MVEIEYKHVAYHGEGWWCAYTTLQNIFKAPYMYETFRDGNIIGVDTMGYKWMTLDQKKEEASQ